MPISRRITNGTVTVGGNGRMVLHRHARKMGRKHTPEYNDEKDLTIVKCASDGRRTDSAAL
jgi:hypothetical protein